MSFLGLTKKPESLVDIKYSVYVYYAASNKHKKPNWEKAKDTTCIKTALRTATDLYQTRKYVKVEILQKIYDKKEERNKGNTVFVFEENKRKNWKQKIDSLLKATQVHDQYKSNN